MTRFYITLWSRKRLFMQYRIKKIHMAISDKETYSIYIDWHDKKIDFRRNVSDTQGANV